MGWGWVRIGVGVGDRVRLRVNLTQWLDGRKAKGQVDLAQLGGGLEEEGEAGSRVVGARDEVARAQLAHLTEGAQRVVGHVQPEDGKGLELRRA